MIEGLYDQGGDIFISIVAYGMSECFHTMLATSRMFGHQHPPSTWPSILLHFREASVRLLGHIGCLGAQGALASVFVSVLFSLSLEDIFCSGGSKGISVRSPVWRTLPIEIIALDM